MLKTVLNSYWQAICATQSALQAANKTPQQGLVKFVDASMHMLESFKRASDTPLVKWGI
jgi:hypothetical protein